jgi:23S rRNA pseudouridine1911/1915/1917 synthase
MEKKLNVPPDAKGARLDKFLHNNLEAVSRTKINKLISQEKVLINGAPKKPSYRLKINDEISIILAEEKKDLLKPFDFKVKIIYEDSDVIVVDKPDNLTVHPPNPAVFETLVNALLYMGKSLSGINPQRPGVVHRLDKETSGVMVLAKNDKSHLKLIEEFAKRQVKKEYLAIAWGSLIKDHLAIDLPLSRDIKNRLKMRVSFLRAKNAYTEVIVKERLKGGVLLLLKPLTGRMHQIRVHLKFMGLPIVGDKKYGIKDNYSQLFLHAQRLGFYHPVKGNFVEFESPMPERFEKFIKEYKCTK